MKRTFILITGLLVMLSCGQKPRVIADDDEENARSRTERNDDDEEEEDDDFKTRKVSFTYDEDKVEVAIHVDYPVAGGRQLVKAVREFISEKLGGTYEGSLDHGRKVVDYYGEQFVCELDSMKVEMRGMTEEENIYGFNKKMDIDKLYETDKLVTFAVSTDIYYSGAHGMQYYYGVTFRKSDGRRFGTAMMRKLDSDEMHQLVKKGLMAYFSEGGERVTTDEELKDYILSGDDVNYLPLPNNEPYVTKDGVEFTYQPYEISFYAAGMPHFTLTKRQVKPFLTSTAREMLE